MLSLRGQSIQAAEEAAVQKARVVLEREIDELVSEDEAAGYTYDESVGAFYVELTEAGYAALRVSGKVESIEPSSGTQPTAAVGSVSDGTPLGVQSVGSVLFAQVYSPFVWGRASVGGLQVALTLHEDCVVQNQMVTSYGLLKGVSTQSTQPAPNNFVPIDPQSLYFETIFKDPSQVSFVTIQPSDCIHVVTTGNDPNDNYVFKTEDRGVQVDDVRAWTSLDGDAVYGRAPAGSRVVVTTGTSSSSTNLSSYLTPGSSLTYAEVNADLGGNFAATAFRTSTDATYKKVDLQQGSRGFVRVIKPTGDETFTFHGQNLFVLERSQYLHGYAFGLPAPLSTSVDVARPATTVTVELKDASGNRKDLQTSAPGAALYAGLHNADPRGRPSPARDQLLAPPSMWSGSYRSPRASTSRGTRWSGQARRTRSSSWEQGSSTDT